MLTTLAGITCILINPSRLLEKPAPSPVCPYACKYVSYNIVFTFWFRLACHIQILGVIIFDVNSFDVQKSAIFRISPYWCHVKIGLTALIFDLVVVAGLTSRSQVPWLAAEQKVIKKNLGSKITPCCNQKLKNAHTNSCSKSLPKQKFLNLIL